MVSLVALWGKNPQIRTWKEWTEMNGNGNNSKFLVFANLGYLFWMSECSATSNLKLFQVNLVFNIHIASILREVKLISEFLIPYNKNQSQLPGEILKCLPNKT